MLHAEFQVFERRGSEEEDFKHFFYEFLCFKPRTPWGRAILDPETFVWSNIVIGNATYQIYIYYISLTPNIYLISLVFSESGRLSFANGIDKTHKEELYLRRVLH